MPTETLSLEDAGWEVRNKGTGTRGAEVSFLFWDVCIILNVTELREISQTVHENSCT